MIKNSKIVAALRRFEELDLSADEHRLLCRVLVMTNRFGYCDESNKELAKYTKICERNVTDIVKSLREKKIINAFYNPHSHSRRIYIKGFVEKYDEEPAFEDMSPEQQKFKTLLPKRIVDCDWPNELDMDKLLEEVKKSKWLMEGATNMTLRSFVRLYDVIISGHYSRGEVNPKESKVKKDAQRLGLLREGA